LHRLNLCLQGTTLPGLRSVSNSSEKVVSGGEDYEAVLSCYCEEPRIIIVRDKLRDEVPIYRDHAPYGRSQ